MGSSQVIGLWEVLDAGQVGVCWLHRVLGKLEAKKLYLLGTKDKLAGVEAYSSTGTVADVAAGVVKYLLQVFSPQDGVINALLHIVEASYDVV